MAAIQQPQIVYNPGSGNVTLPFLRGPQNFAPDWSVRGNNNLSTSGAARERVVQAKDILIAFEMQHIIVDQDLAGWQSFMSFALDGGQFKFFPNAALGDFYNCVEESMKLALKRNAPKKYAGAFLFRILNDSQAPADPGYVLRRFYGVTTP